MKALRQLRHLLVCLLLMACPGLAVAGVERVLSWHDQALQTLGPWLQVLPRSSMPASLEALPRLDQSRDLGWQPLSGQQLNLGLEKGPRLFRLTVDNTAVADTLILALSRASLSRITLLSQDGNGTWQRQEAGIDTLTLSSPLPVPGYGFQLQLPEGRSTHYLQIQSDYPLSSPVLLGTLGDMVRHAVSSAGWFGFGLGLMCSLFILLRARLFVSGTLRWSSSLLQMAGILYVMTDRGVLGNWWFSLPGMQHGLLEISVLLVQITWIWHVLQILREREALTHPRLQALVASIGILALILMVTLVIPHHTRSLLLRLPVAVALVAVMLLCLHQRLVTDKCFQWLLVPAVSWLLIQGLQLAGEMGLLGDWPEPYWLSIAWFATMPIMIILALHKAARRDREQRRELPSEDSAMHVLVVEDNQWVRDVMRGLLGKLGARVTLLHDGHEALSWMRRNVCDLVLMDCDLPGMSGLDTTRQWRQHERKRALRRLPIIAITAHVSESQRRAVMASGMDGFLAKPIDMRTLHETLVRWTSKTGHGAA